MEYYHILGAYLCLTIIEEVRRVTDDHKYDYFLHIIDRSVNIPGTPEIGGLTTIQVLEIIRGCRGLNVVGGDLVEVRGFEAMNDEHRSRVVTLMDCVHHWCSV